MTDNRQQSWARSDVLVKNFKSISASVLRFFSIIAKLKTIKQKV